jgi:CheY-like chemotaxis protein
MRATLSRPDSSTMTSWSSRPLVLLAEDDPDIRSLVGTLLERWGYEVMAAANGRDAFELAASRPPVLAVLDVGMPPPDGLELTRSFRDDPQLADVPVILLSAHAGDDRPLAARAAGATGYVTKPFRAQALRKAIWSVVPAAPGHAA